MEQVHWGISQWKSDTWLNNHVQIATSAITAAEYRVYPYRTGNMEEIDAFEDFLNECDITVYPVNYETAKKAAQKGNY